MTLDKAEWIGGPGMHTSLRVSLVALTLEPVATDDDGDDGDDDDDDNDDDGDVDDDGDHEDDHDDLHGWSRP